jgi:hypothetical protein
MHTHVIDEETFPVELRFSRWMQMLSSLQLDENIIQLQSSFATALDHLIASCCIMAAQKGTQA